MQLKMYNAQRLYIMELICGQLCLFRAKKNLSIAFRLLLSLQVLTESYYVSVQNFFGKPLWGKNKKLKPAKVSALIYSSSYLITYKQNGGGGGI